MEAELDKNLLSLDMPVEPYRIDLTGTVWVRVRPLDTPLFEAAKARAWRRVAELREHVAAVREEGGDVSGLPDFTDADVRDGYAQSLLITALAQMGIVAWGGIRADFSEDAVAKLMRRPEIAADFYRKYFAPVESASAEGNASAAGSAGTSEPVGDIAKGA